jgi:hypothetical protein
MIRPPADAASKLQFDDGGNGGMFMIQQETEGELCFGCSSGACLVAVLTEAPVVNRIAFQLSKSKMQNGSKPKQKAGTITKTNADGEMTRARILMPV